MQWSKCSWVFAVAFLFGCVNPVGDEPPRPGQTRGASPAPSPGGPASPPSDQPPSPTPPPEAGSDRLSVMTYNVGITEMSPRRQNADRAKLMRTLMDEREEDVIVFTELFTQRARRILFEGKWTVIRWWGGIIPYPKTFDLTGLEDIGYSFEGPPNQFNRPRNGGIFVGSRHPIDLRDTLVFDARDNVPTTVPRLCLPALGGADCLDVDPETYPWCLVQEEHDCPGLTWFHAKGAIYAEVRKRGEPYHVFGTHLQHGCSPEQRAERLDQIDELAGFIRDQDIPRGEAIVVAGDFNIGPDQGGNCAALSVDDITSRISDALGPIEVPGDDLDVSTVVREDEEDDGDTLDHIFVFNRPLEEDGREYEILEWGFSPVVGFPQDVFGGITSDGREAVFPSDHHPLIGTFDFSPFDVRITAPEEGQGFDELDRIRLSAELFDERGAVVSDRDLVWSYYQDGVYHPLGVRTRTFASAWIGPFCAGQYRIQARAEDTGATDSVTIGVENVPNDVAPAECRPAPDEVLIDQPIDGARIPLGDELPLTASVNHDPPLHGVFWYEAPADARLEDGGPSGGRRIGMGTASRTKIGPGAHTIWVNYGDARDHVEVEVVDTANRAPFVRITSPERGARIDERGARPTVLVDATATATDPEDGALTGDAIAWEYKREGGVWRRAGAGGESVTLELDDESCSATPYDIRAIATDSAGLTDSYLTDVEVFWVGC